MSKKKIKKIAKNVTQKGKKFAKKTGETIAKNPVQTVYLVGGVLAIFIGYKVYKSISNKFSGADIDDTIDNVGTGTTTNATISDQEAINYANQLLTAFNKNRNSWLLGGTDEPAVEAVFDKLQNGDDFLLVFQAFGTKDYNGYNSPVEDWTGAIGSSEKVDLLGWLQSEINSWLDADLYDKIKARVESAGFTF